MQAHSLGGFPQLDLCLSQGSTSIPVALPAPRIHLSSLSPRARGRGGKTGGWGRQGKHRLPGRKGRFISVYPEIPASLLLIQLSPAGCRLGICTEPVLRQAIHHAQAERAPRGAGGGRGCAEAGVLPAPVPPARTPPASSAAASRLLLSRSPSPAGSGPRRAIIFLSWTR